MAPADDDSDSTGYEYFRETRVIYIRTYEVQKIDVAKESKVNPIWLKGRKNKRDNFKFK